MTDPLERRRMDSWPAEQITRTFDEINRQLKRIGDFIEKLPDSLDEKFIRRERYEADERRRDNDRAELERLTTSHRVELERLITEVGTKTVDIGASTKRLWAKVEDVQDDMLSKKALYALLTAIAALAAGVGTLIGVLH